MNAPTVGVDFGGTNIKVGLVRPAGRVTARAVLATRDHLTPAKFLAGLERVIGRQRVGGVGRRIGGIGIGAPGLIDGRRGIIHQLVNVPGGWRGVPLKRLLERRFRCPCAVDNDVNVIALGEWRHGAGRGTSDSIYVTLGTGVGGSVVANGRLVRGATGSAGEIGHMCVDAEGPRCGCGRQGCLEALIGTPAILRQARQAARRSRGSLARLARASGGRLTPAMVSQAARVGDPAACRVWRDVGTVFGVSLANLINLLNPERIVVGGGIGNAWPWFAPSMRAAIRARAFEVPAKACRVVLAQLGDDAGIIGGAILVRELQNVKERP